MGKGSSTPSYPDPYDTADAQTASNKETAMWNAALNNINQITPYGSLTYKQISKGDENNPSLYQSTINLSPETQAMYDQQLSNQNKLLGMGTKQLSRINNAVSTPYTYKGLSDYPTYTDYNGLQDTAYDAIMSRMNEDFSSDEEGIRTRLINQGIAQGSEAYNTEMNQFNRAKTDARLQGTLSAQKYASGLLGDSLAARQQAIQEYSTQRNAPLNEYTALTSGTQIQNPTFSTSGYGGAQSGDIQGAVNSSYQAQLDAANAKNASSNSTMESLFGLGSSLIGVFSDIRLKENIVKVGKTDGGHNVYLFNYKSDPDKRVNMGVMAQEVMETQPDAVIIDESGFYKVNYGVIK